MNNLTFGDRHMGYYETIAGGAGAGPHWHGRSGVHTHMTNTRITDPEILERRYPVRAPVFWRGVGPPQSSGDCYTASSRVGSTAPPGHQGMAPQACGHTHDRQLCSEAQTSSAWLTAHDSLTSGPVGQVALRQFQLRKGSGGSGRWRGGDGVIRDVPPLPPPPPPTPSLHIAPLASSCRLMSNPILVLSTSESCGSVSPLTVFPVVSAMGSLAEVTAFELGLPSTARAHSFAS